MQPKTREMAMQHAIEIYPNESCGLVIVANGKERYIPCTNKATSRSDHFIISAEQYADAEDQGAITAVVHSHPDANAKPSEADLVSCENSGLPWYIFATHTKEDGSVAVFAESAFEPSGYQAPLVGRQFAHGVLDCYTLCRDWYQREQSITLPDFPRTDEWWLRGENLYMTQFEKAGFEVVHDGTLEVGDGIIMQIRAPEPNHAGIYIGDGLFLHHLYGRLSSRDVYGGYWKEHTHVIVRRKKTDA